MDATHTYTSTFTTILHLHNAIYRHIMLQTQCHGNSVYYTYMMHLCKLGKLLYNHAVYKELICSGGTYAASTLLEF